MRLRRRLTSFLAFWLSLAIALPPAPAWALRGAQILQNQSGLEELKDRIVEPSEQITAVRERAESLARIFERLLFNLVKRTLGRPISWTEAREEIGKEFYRDSKLAELMPAGNWTSRDILLILFKTSNPKIPAEEMAALLGDSPTDALQWVYFYFLTVKEKAASLSDHPLTDEAMHAQVWGRIFVHSKGQASILELQFAQGIIQRSDGFLRGMQVMAGEEIGRTFSDPAWLPSGFRRPDLNNDKEPMLAATLLDWAQEGILVIRDSASIPKLAQAIVAERRHKGSFKDGVDFGQRMRARQDLKTSSAAWMHIAMRSEFLISERTLAKGVGAMAAVALAIIGFTTWNSVLQDRQDRNKAVRQAQRQVEPKPARQNPDYKLPGQKNSSQFQEISPEELYRQPVGVFLPAPIRQIAGQKLIGKRVVIRGRMTGGAEGVVTEIVGVLEKVMYDNGVFYELILAKEFRILKGASGLSTRLDGSPSILIYVERKDPIQIELAPEEKAGLEERVEAGAAQWQGDRDLQEDFHHLGIHLKDSAGEWLGTIQLVADGLGGHQAGEVASKMAVEKLAKRLSAITPLLNFGRRVGKVAWQGIWNRLVNEVEHAFLEAHQEIFTPESLDSPRSGMGTTLVLSLIFPTRSGPQAGIFWVGDSPAFQWRASSRQVIPLTYDDTLEIGYQISLQNLSEEQLRDPTVLARLSRTARETPALGNGAGLGQYLGQEHRDFETGHRTGKISKIQVHSNLVSLEPGDVILLATDGLTKGLTIRNTKSSEEAIKEVLLAQPVGISAQALAEQLLEASRRAMKESGKKADNVTVVAGRIPDSILTGLEESARMFANQARKEGDVRIVLGPTAFHQVPGLGAAVNALREAGLKDRFIVLPDEVTDQLFQLGVEVLGLASPSLKGYAAENDRVMKAFQDALQGFRIPFQRSGLSDLTLMVRQILLDLGVPEATATTEAVDRFLALTGLEEAA